MNPSKFAASSADADAEAGHIGMTGEHLCDLFGADTRCALRVRDVFSSDLADILLGWHRREIQLGDQKFFRYLGDAGPNTPSRDNPWLSDLLVVPTTAQVPAVGPLVAEALAGKALVVPDRSACLAWDRTDRAAGGDGGDADADYAYAVWATDPDLVASAPGEVRICGVPQSTYDVLTTAEQAKVRANKVIAPPQAPTYVARWLVRRVFSTRQLLPATAGGRRRWAWMRTLVRIDQTWYEYTSTGAGDPPRWVARTDPEWMRATLRAVLVNLWYVKGRTEKGQTVYDRLKAWNPDTRTLAMVEDALADLLAAGSGTGARELADLFGRRRGVYSGGTRLLVRNGVLNVETGQVVTSTALWFSPARIEADYDHDANPYADCAWLRMLRDQWGDDLDAITCIQQWFGYVLSGRTDLQKWMLIIGPSGSGKSIIADVLGKLLGVVSATKLDSLNSQFGLQSLYESGTTLAVMSDIRFGQRDTTAAVGNLLAVTGEDEVTIERKYKTAVTAKLPIRFHGSANEMPRWSDNSSALQRRALLLETSRGFRGTEADDPTLKHRILANELGQVLRWAVGGLALLNAADGRFTRSAHADELDAALAELSSPVRTFVNQCCEIGTAEDFVDLKGLYAVFKGWAETTNSGKGMSQTGFNKALKGLYLDPVRPGQKKTPRGKWEVVWGIQRAETEVSERNQFGSTSARTISTDPVGDPWRGIN